MWLFFIVIVLVLLVLDLGVLHRNVREIGVKESLGLSAFYITLGLLFGAWVWWYIGPTAGLNYVTGFVIEKSLAMDNILSLPWSLPISLSLEFINTGFYFGESSALSFLEP